MADRPVKPKDSKTTPVKSRETPERVLLQIEFGLQAEVVLLTREDWRKFLFNWELAGEDVVLRIPGKNMERNIVLRGTTSAIISILNEHREGVAAAAVITMEELRGKAIAEWRKSK